MELYAKIAKNPICLNGFWIRLIEDVNVGILLIFCENVYFSVALFNMLILFKILTL